MKAHKYWSIGAIVTMVGTFYTADYIFNKAVKNCECYIDLYMD